ncbi:hypothetical protein GCM10017083_11740 [Thalassobaculum fulvum]|jgi:hypothetical protein|uniref:DUF6916 domain-containing protein n=1 Tax=Thalassobaculum fulvum TaxID=1633335 RepID=A0A919CNL3_9PROT|nr:hypothetical protein [Thalassobaculum fulvum]GHD44385.1 hypothetical protein GCM10017083_11740 [Thalassobaculum fulvum]
MNQTVSTSLYALRAETFRDKVGQLFYLEGPEGALAITLVRVWEGKEPLFRGTERRPFSLFFLGPPSVRARAHVMTNLRHPRLGLIEGVFIGPVAGEPPPQFGQGQLWSADFT